MPTFDDVRRIALALPETSEQPIARLRALEGQGQGVRVGAPAAPAGPQGARRRRARRARSSACGSSTSAPRRRCSQSDPDVYFTTPHFDGYPAVLVQLEKISERRADRDRRRGVAQPRAAEARADSTSTRRSERAAHGAHRGPRRRGSWRAARALLDDVFGDELEDVGLGARARRRARAGLGGRRADRPRVGGHAADAARRPGAALRLRRGRRACARTTSAAATAAR